MHYNHQNQRSHSCSSNCKSPKQIKTYTCNGHGLETTRTQARAPARPRFHTHVTDTRIPTRKCAQQAHTQRRTYAHERRYTQNIRLCCTCQTHQETAMQNLCSGWSNCVLTVYTCRSPRKQGCLPLPCATRVAKFSGLLARVVWDAHSVVAHW